MLPAATRVYTLPDGLGYHTVRVQYLDGAGNYSLVYNDYIKLVDPPAGTTETLILPGSVPFEMVWIPGGSFLMGRYTDEENSEYHEDPQHSVSVSGFWLGKYPVTKAQWTAVAGSTPWVGQSDPNLDPNSPAIYLSWDTVQAFIGGFSTLLGKTYHLPSESQWEYACRAGTQTRFYWGDDLDYTLIGDYAWYAGNCYPDHQYAHNVGLKLPNKWGLYDMSGNVWEWCQDTWHDTYAGAPADGTAWGGEETTARVVRGGMYNEAAWISRSAKRDNYAAWGAMTTVGFRLAR
jgi:formylglycine-generating enzyme required for sulfatase activity